MYDAAKHMEHFLENTGSEYGANVSAMVLQSRNAKSHFYQELNDAMAFAEQQSVSGTFHIVSEQYTPGSVPKSDNWNWYFAIHGYNAYGAGRVTRLPNCTYRMGFSFYIDDMYNWDAQKAVLIPGLGKVADRTLGQLHLAGLAREFHVIGSHSLFVNWKKGDRFDVTTGKVAVSKPDR
jgi:hypothetical protein